MLDSFCIVFFKTLATIIPLLRILRFAFNHPFQLQEPPTLPPLQYFVCQCFFLFSSCNLQKPPTLPPLQYFVCQCFFCFPAISSSCLSLSLYELVIIQHYNHHWFAKTQKSFTNNYSCRLIGPQSKISFSILKNFKNIPSLECL